MIYAGTTGAFEALDAAQADPGVAGMVLLAVAFIALMGAGIVLITFPIWRG